MSLTLGDCRGWPREDGDVVISDPPFNIGYHYKGYSDRMKRDEWLALLAEVCAPPCVLILYPEAMFEVARALDEIPTRCVSWVYPSNTARQHRMIAWFGVEPNFRAIGQPYRNPTDKRIAKRIAEGKQARLYDWWDVNQVKNVSKEKTSHPCQMPLEVMRRVVAITPAKRIVDPFAGSGTTLVAAQAQGREWAGWEMDEEYAGIAQGRINAAMSRGAHR